MHSSSNSKIGSEDISTWGSAITGAIKNLGLNGMMYTDPPATHNFNDCKLNSIVVVYTSTEWVNAPGPGTTAFIVLTTGNSSVAAMQLAASWSNYWYVRARSNSSTWSSWKILST